MENKKFLSSYRDFCTGYGNPDNPSTGYILALNLAIGKAEIQFRHPGSDMLDKTNAFDMAEATGAYIGQINMITVSSFCGPQGLIWGYDIVRHPDLDKQQSLLLAHVPDWEGKKEVPVYSAQPLIDATRALFGVRDNQRFPILPGSHVPCATKSITKSGPATLYCAIGIGIPEDRSRNACLLMEDIGELNLDQGDAFLADAYKSNILMQVAKSVIVVGKNQQVKYKEIYVALGDISIEGGEVGCALIAAPYINLAQNALPKTFETVDDLRKISLIDWEKSVKQYFLHGNQ